jgi:hypothetical protein
MPASRVLGLAISRTVGARESPAYEHSPRLAMAKPFRRSGAVSCTVV